MNVKRILLILALSLSGLALTACGGSSGGSGGGSGNQISGNAIQGPINGATVKVFSVKPNGNNDQLLCEGVTSSDNTGYFSISGCKAPANGEAVRILVSGGSYTSEATGDLVSKNKGSVLSSLLSAMPASDIVISPLTTFADSLATKKMASSASISLKDIIAQAEKDIADKFGLPANTDLTQLVPDFSAKDGAEAMTALILGSLEQLAEETGKSPSEIVAEIADDLSDGSADDTLFTDKLPQAISDYLTSSDPDAIIPDIDHDEAQNVKDAVSGNNGQGDNGQGGTGNVTLAAPDNVSLTAGDQAVTVTWDDVDDATGYELCYATESIADYNNCNSLQNGHLILKDVTSPYQITGLTNGTTYYARVAATDDSQTGPASSDKNATPRVIVTGNNRLNDTGVTTCGNYVTADKYNGHFNGFSDADNHLNCSAVGVTQTTAGEDTNGKPVPAGQDALYGRDARAMAGKLQKVGGGHAGFDFTKVGSSGDNAYPDWACVTDNNTGLTWEVKTREVDNPDPKKDPYRWHMLHDWTHVFTWYNPGGNPSGSSNTGHETKYPSGNDDNRHKCLGTCSTDNFIGKVNSHALCGYTDWRLPTIDELMTLVDFGSKTHRLIDTDYFPNTPGGMASGWWSSTPGYNRNSTDDDRTDDEFSGVWVLNFTAGRIDGGIGGSGYGVSYVRLVRGGQ